MMNILVCRWDIFPYNDIISTLKKQGHQTDVLAFSASNHDNIAFQTELTNKLTTRHYDVVFTVNYFAEISILCHRLHIKYISWTCDSPLIAMRHQSVVNLENTIYTFDSKEALDFNREGIKTVHYLPLAAAPERLSSLTHVDKYKYDLSFVGNLYDKNRYEEMTKALPDYLCGYMDAAIEAQMNITGGNILQTMLTDDIISDMSPYIKIEHTDDSTAGIKIHFATSVLSHKVAARTRIKTLNNLGKEYPHKVHLFTTSDTSPLCGVSVHNPVRYEDEMPAVYSSSKINLNMTAPNIETGIPLRVFDILSAGGFLITDYRADLNNCFTIGHDLVVYDDINDLKEKVRYYLSHESERLQIAKNGLNTIKKLHTYDMRLRQILSNL